MMWDIDQMKPLSATVVLSLFTPSFRRSTASSGSRRVLIFFSDVKLQISWTEGD